MSEVIGNRYELREQVGSGGMATVHRGHDPKLNRDVAIKIMHPHLAQRADARRRFTREAHSVAQLKHPNILAVYDYSGEADDRAYIVSEFIEGVTLSRFAETWTPLLPQSAALIGHAVAGALAHAHEARLVHRDIKPDNLMIRADGVIKLMDFGIATAMDVEKMTATGAILGSPAHMSPEQIEGTEIDHRADIFAFGTVLYFLVTGHLPFYANNPHALFRQILDGQYEPASSLNAAVNEAFEEILARCMARQPDDRYPDMLSVMDALEGFLSESRMTDRRALLAHLLTAPGDFDRKWRPVLVELQTAEAERLAARGEIALALKACNSALGLMPDADAPRRVLRDLSARAQRQRRRKLGLRVGAGLAALLLLGLGVRALLSAPRPAEPVDIGDDAGALALAAPSDAEPLEGPATADQAAASEQAAAARATGKQQPDGTQQPAATAGSDNGAAIGTQPAGARPTAAPQDEPARAAAGGTSPGEPAQPSPPDDPTEPDRDKPTAKLDPKTAMRVARIAAGRFKRGAGIARRGTTGFSGARDKAGASGETTGGKGAAGQDGDAPDAPRGTASGGPQPEPAPQPRFRPVTTVIGSNPPQADIFIDGRKRGTGFYRATLMTGKTYHIECRPQPTCKSCRFVEMHYTVPANPVVNDFGVHYAPKCQMTAQGAQPLAPPPLP